MKNESVITPQSLKGVRHGFYRDFTPAQLNRIEAGLGQVPGRGDSDLWEKFQQDRATVLYSLDSQGEIPCFAFFELRKNPDSNVTEFFLAGAIALKPSANLVRHAFPIYERTARLLGCKVMALQTPRVGLVNEILKMPGWKISRIFGGEVTLRKLLL